MSQEEEDYLQHATQNANVMDNFGSDLADPDSHQSVEKRKETRIRRGECPSCRRKTHKVSRFPFGSKREPLNVEGEVVNGLCLRCIPVKRGPRQAAIPDRVDVPCSSKGADFSYAYDDDITVASEITMDPYLTAPPVNSRPSVGESSSSRYFESVSEETPMTDFGRHAEDDVAGLLSELLQDERRERERDIVREQETRGARGGNTHHMQPGRKPGRQCRRGGERVILEEDTTEYNDKEEWENHEHLLREMEQQQKFHPLAVQHRLSFMSNSVMSNMGESLSPENLLHDMEQKQKFHPLAMQQNDVSYLMEESMSQMDLLHAMEQNQQSHTGAVGNNSSYLTEESISQRDLLDDTNENEQSHPENTSNLENSLSHEQLLRDMEQNQQYHPLAGHNMSYSENSISVTEDRETNETSYTTTCRSSTATGGAYKAQQFHPLSTIAQFNNSEPSISLNDDISQASASVQSSDSDKIQRLCQGSRSNGLMEFMDVEKSPTRESDSPIMRLPSTGSSSMSQRSHSQRKPRERRSGGARSKSNRFSLKRLSNASDDENEKSSFSRTASGRKIGERKDSNRFSLTRLDSKGDRLGVDTEGSNRFSLLLGNGKPNRKSTSDIPPNLLMEMNASKNWDSMDILRHAAAEANGEDLDAEVDAIFGVVSTVDTEKDRGPAAPPPQKQKQRSDRRRRSSGTISPGGLSHQDEINIMATALSRGATSTNEEEVLATTITRRRRSVSSQDCEIKLSTIKDIPVIIQAVISRPNDKKCVERAFQSLFLLATDPDPEEGSLARKEILANSGMETLVSAIWDHLQHSEVLLVLFHALWAISVFNGNDEKSSKASVSKIQECSVLEGLLFAMQSHAKDLSIQESGCDLITRLTGLLPIDTLEFKSAVIFLSSNMESMSTNTKAYASCLDALNSLCQLSDENKHAFVEAGNDCHREIIRGLASSDASSDTPSPETRELACQLFWCVTSDRTAVSVLSANGLLLKKIIDAMTSVPPANSLVHFFGAACGTLANLALEQNNHSKMIDLGVVPILCEAIYLYDSSEDVNSAACTALANLSASKEIRKIIASQGGIPALFSAMKSTSDNPDIQSEVFRALHNLCESSSDGKQAIVADLETIITAYFRHEKSKYIQQITCSIIFRLSAEEKCRKSMIVLPKTFDVLAKIMESNLRKKMVQKAACSALKNLSTEDAIIPTLLSKGFDSLVIDAMDAYSDNEELQESACTFLMNMGSNSPEALVEICSGEGLHCIVKAMQALPTSVALQQASCCALRAFTKGDAHKSMAVSVGAVDAVVYVMLIHPMEIEAIENAVVVLANLSTLKKYTKTIANAGGISTVIETMRNNPSSPGLILSGSRFIGNMALSGSEYANEALGGIMPILGCMDEHPDCATLVEESCKALRCLVLKSESCKDVVISSDGVTVIEKTMEQNSTSQRWQTLLLDELFQ